MGKPFEMGEAVEVLCNFGAGEEWHEVTVIGSVTPGTVLVQSGQASAFRVSDAKVRRPHEAGIYTDASEQFGYDPPPGRPAPIATRPTDPAPPADPLLCPRCSTPSHPVAMRTRGEVRSRVWRCGCVVAPEVTADHPVFIAAYGHPTIRESLWQAHGHGVTANHPTEAGAIAAWRVALERRQQEEDEALSNPTPVLAPWRLAVMGGESRDFAPGMVSHEEAVAETGRLSVAMLTREEWLANVNGCTVEDLRAQGYRDEAAAASATPASLRMYATLAAHKVGDAHAAFARFDYADGVRLLGEAAAQRAVEAVQTGSGAIDHEAFEKAVAARVAEQYLAREREALATLPTRTDDEVRQVAAACTEATHVETLVAVANECARRWPERVPAAVNRPHWSGRGWRFEADRGDVMLRDGGSGCVAMWTLAGQPYGDLPTLHAVVRALGVA